MAGLPKWQQPLAERAAAADERIRMAMRAAGGGAGAMLAIAAGDRELAELCREVAERTQSPLLKQLLQHGARALAVLAVGVETDVWAHTEHDAGPAAVEASVDATAAAADEQAEVEVEQVLAELVALGLVEEVTESDERPAADQRPVDVDEDQAQPLAEPAEAGSVADLEECRTEAEWRGLTVYRPGSTPPEPVVLVDGEPWRRVGHTQVPDQTLWCPVDLAPSVVSMHWREMVAGHVVATRTTSEQSAVEVSLGSLPLLEQLQRLRGPAAPDAPVGAP